MRVYFVQLQQGNYPDLCLRIRKPETGAVHWVSSQFPVIFKHIAAEPIIKIHLTCFVFKYLKEENPSFHLPSK